MISGDDCMAGGSILADDVDPALPAAKLAPRNDFTRLNPGRRWSNMANEKPPYASGFSEVLVDELNLIRRRRKEILREELKRQEKDVENSGDVLELKADADADARLTQARLLALDEHLTGISFSGGGIRSGTFAVGLLQGLSSLGLLRRFDYLSTVSGGGYAGGWLASWLKRDGDVRNVERQLAPSRVRQGEAYRDFLNPPPGDDYPTTAK